MKSSVDFMEIRHFSSTLLWHVSNPTRLKRDQSLFCAGVLQRDKVFLTFTLIFHSSSSIDRQKRCFGLDFL